MADILTFLIDDSRFKIVKSAVINFNKKFDVNFNTQLLKIDIEENFGFNISMMISFDNQNWSTHTDLNEIPNLIEAEKAYCLQNGIEFQLYLRIVCKIIDKFHHSYTQLQTNINQNNPIVIFKEIFYDTTSLNKDITIEYYYEPINIAPTFNLYDNSEVTVNRWLANCIALSNSHGWQVIYFKTEPIEESKIHTLNSNGEREVVAIKKFMISVPDNQFPTDKIIYNEWDQAMIDEFQIHIVDELFKYVFGHTIPIQKDYMFIPLLNKIYSINSVQPGQKYMGALGWWECFLTKYEKDEIVKEVDIDALVNHIRNNVDYIPNLSDDDLPDIYAEFDEMREDGLMTDEKNEELTIEEKKYVTDNLNSRVTDSTAYISPKETEEQKDFYFTRPNILSINQSTSKFPLFMYDNTSIEKRTLGMIYDLKNLVSINKYKTTIINQDKFNFKFNFVFLKRYSNEIFDFASNDLIVFSILLNGKNLVLKYENFEHKISFEFTTGKIYIVNLSESKVLIYENNELKHTFEYNIYNNNNVNWDLNKIYMYGGQFYISKPSLTIKEKLIFEDKTIPVLNNQKFNP